MSLSVIDLGELRLASSTSALELTISSAATLDASAGASHARDRSISIDRLMAAPADKPLIRASRLLTFTITLILHENVADGTEAQGLLRKFVHCLKSAQLWNQLDLTPRNVEVTSDHASNAHRIVLGLTCTDGSADDRRPPPHKLPMGACSLDMRVPDSIQTAELSAVELEFRLVGSSVGDREYQKAQKSTRSDCDQLPGRTTAFETHDGVSLDLSTDYSLPEQIGHDWSRHASISRQDSLFEDERDEWSGLMSVDYNDPSQETPESSQQASEQPACDQSAELASSLNMLLAAVRFAITKNPVKLAKGIRIVSSKSFRHLSEIAPAVWSPSCCRGLATRAVFLPTIDHALGTVGGAHALSKTLRAKMAEVQRRSGRGTCPPERLTGGRTDTSATSPGTAEQLWRTMQHKLLNSEDANRLRPLKEAALGSGFSDDDIMGTDWDFMNESCPKRCIGAMYPHSDSLFDPLEEEDMLAAWEDVQSSQSPYEEPSPGIGDVFRNRDSDNEPSVDMDLISWELERDAYEDMLDF